MKKMRNEIRIALIVCVSIVFLFVPAVSAFNVSTPSYSIGSVHMGLVGNNGSTSSYVFRGVLTYQQPGNDYVNYTSYLASLGFLEGVGIYTPPEENPPNPPPDNPPAPSGPSPGLGPSPAPSECTYDWLCTEWEPSGCPENGMQTRTCSNQGTCTGTEEKPDESRICEYNPLVNVSDGILDIRIKIPDYINISDNVSFLIDITYLMPGEADVVLNYLIKNRYNDIVYSEREVISVDGGLSFEKSFNFSGLDPEQYLIIVEASYGDHIADDGKSFTLLRRELMPGEFILIPYVNLIVWLSIIIVIIVLLWFFIFKFSLNDFLLGMKVRRVKKSLKKVDKNIRESKYHKGEHSPIIKRTEHGVRVRAGTVPHPMRENHYIKWIEIEADGKIFRKSLKPGDSPVAEFETSAKNIRARTSCSVHGIWKSKS